MTQPIDITGQTDDNHLEQMASQLQQLAKTLQQAGRNDLLLRAVGVPLLEELLIEAARVRLSRLLITKDFRFFLMDHNNREIEMQPVHKAVYLFFLAHPEGIEFKHLQDYRDELSHFYMATAKLMDKEKIVESINHLVNPLDNAINEKCSRIKNVFRSLMDDYCANYYIISSHNKRHFNGSERIWFERLKIITLPRHLVINQTDLKF
ncbi:MAG: hypothetical protein J5506_01340 [Prevotella sp.]|nr:hypothetical protein [Prevotella sp.]